MIMYDITATLCPLKQHPRASGHNLSCASIHAYVRESIPGETVVFERSGALGALSLQYSIFHDDDAK